MFSIDSLLVFTKTTDLSAWFKANNQPPREYYFAKNPEEQQRVKAMYDHHAAHYDKEREIQLIVQVCFQNNSTYCRIRCPINPLPVNGWFETPSINILRKHLEHFGWKYEHLIPKSMLHI